MIYLTLNTQTDIEENVSHYTTNDTTKALSAVDRNEGHNKIGSY